ncbi:hypothetical protein EST62_07155 [Chlorobaculum sp. 24CR]|uniref:SWIM zinc finger family protein n=1 Tax=Chlorobaculum sp. 24CR TaxID=2508878 RepID=UPI00100A899E|nr:SWIM zinc finger family protein [Chlorobaculum sp. 24CR]RXK85216.1 hypothetical protein EST62_07155 [Chlorobaculum sp. 24CR]
MAYYGWYKPTAPKKVDSGIKTQSKRGAFAKQWWGKEWISRLERFNDSARLGRGRAYARKGQVTGLDVTSKGVSAKVQGSRVRPYNVSIRLTPYSNEEWRRFVGVLGDNPLLVARMLAGEMPEEIERLCSKAGIALFPNSFRDMEASCSCPDYAIPCKHLAAVFYLLAEAFDRDPFLLFTLRGIEKDALFKALDGNHTDEPERQTGKKKKPVEPLPVDADVFWSSPDGAALPALHYQQPSASAILVRRLGAIPFWRSGRNFLDEMETTCKAASASMVDMRQQQEQASG